MNRIAAHLFSLLLLAAPLCAEPQSVAQSDYSGRPLPEIAQVLLEQAGIDVRLSATLRAETAGEGVRGDSWGEIAERAFAGRNTVVVRDPSGGIFRIYVLGVGESPADLTPGSKMASVWQLEPVAADALPPAYAALRPQGVYAVRMPDLTAARAGARARMTLPGGDATLVVEESKSVEGGLHSVRGYFEEFGPWHTVHLAGDAKHYFGTLVTPYGEYNLETQNGTTYLVDLEASGVTTVPLVEDGEAAPSAGAELAAAGADIAAQQDAGADLVTAGDGPRIVDVLVLYTANVNGQETRARYLVDYANTILANSQATFRFRVVGVRLVSYPENTQNAAALYEMTDNVGVFAGLEALRTELGADLVTLLRPFNYPATTDCGRGFVLGMNGTVLNGRWAYSVVSDGVSGSYYCATQTMAHEFGHNLGNAHDHNDSLKGHRADSHGHFVSGSFGTVMSYATPKLAFFSNPGLTCKYVPCGIPMGLANAANTVASMEVTAPVVAEFRVEPPPVVVPQPEPVVQPEPAVVPQPDPDPNALLQEELTKARADVTALTAALSQARTQVAARAKTRAAANAALTVALRNLTVARAEVTRLTRAKAKYATLTRAKNRVAALTQTVASARARVVAANTALAQAQAQARAAAAALAQAQAKVAALEKLV